MAAKTMFEKIWESHVVRTEPDGTPSCMWTVIWSMKSLHRRRLKVCNLPGVNPGARKRPSPCPITTCRPLTETSRLLTWLAPNRSRPYRKTARPLAFPFLT